MEKNIKWAIYARKSTESEDKQIQSIDDQIKYLTDMADREGLEIVEILTEAKSAKEPYKRIGFTELIRLIETGKINGLLVWKMDRLSRNPIDSATIQYFLQKEKLLCIKSSEKNYFPEDNALLMSVENGMANQYIRDLSKNVKRGMHSKAEKGWFPNIPPIGYLNSKTREKGAETILTDPERFLIVRKMWDLVLTGNYSLPKVLRIATEEWGLRTIPRKRLGGKSLSVSYMYKMFTNMFYAGSFMYGGKMYIGKHEAMITMDEFDQVQILLGKKGKPRSQKHDFPFTGIMYCGECGARITASKKQKLLVNGLYNTHTYYHCTGRKKYAACSQERLKLAELEQSVIKILEDNLINERFYQLGLEVLGEMHELEIGKRQEIFEAQQRNVLETQRKLDSLLGFLINQTISEPQYKVEKIRLETELTKEKIKLSDTEARARNWTNLTENVVHYARLASEVFIDINTPNQIKREILSSLGLNHRIETKKLFIDLHGWFSVLKKGENELIPQIEALERDKTLTPERRKEAFASFRTKLCAGKDLNLRSPKATDLQSVVIDRSTTDAGPRHKIGCGTIVPYLRKNSRYH
jgi:site-specific DNA recombinase